jgi:nucleoside 2-deoxyribosyltransferase
VRLFNIRGLMDIISTQHTSDLLPRFVRNDWRLLKMRLFLAAPFTGLISSTTSLLEPAYDQWLREIVSGLRRAGFEVDNAHEREAWGAQLMTPEKALIYDFEAIADADVLVAYIGVPPSPGVQMELGFAAARQKPIVIITDSGLPLPYLVNGLSAATRVLFLDHDAAQILVDRLTEQLPAFVKAA